MITLSENKGFKLIPEGITVFKIVKVDYDSEMGKLEIHMATQDGSAHKERFQLVNNLGEVNEKAVGAFSWFARTALQSDVNESYEIDEQELVGHYIEAEVTHVKREGKGKYEGKTYTNVQLKNYAPADSFDDDEVELNF